MTELKPCPFCGSNNIDILDTSSINHLNLNYFARCKSCGSTSKIFQERSDAENAWNRRDTTDELEV